MPDFSSGYQPLEAWHDRLCVDHQEILMRVLTRQLNGDIHAAQDLCQQTLLTAWVIALRGNSSLPIKENERVWLFTIAHNQLRNHRRRSRLDRQLPYDDDAVSLLQVSEAADSALHFRDIDPDKRLSALSVDDRLVLDLRYVDDLSSEEIAQVLGIKPATARQRLYRAMRRASDLLIRQADPSPSNVQRRNTP